MTDVAMAPGLTLLGGGGIVPPMAPPLIPLGVIGPPGPPEL